MATQIELETMAQWLEAQGFVSSKRRCVTQSYLALVFGRSTTPELKEVCRYLVAHREEPVHWLKLRRIAQVRAIQAKAS